MAPPPTGTAAWWVVGMGALVVAAILIGAMRRRTDVLIEQLYDAARTTSATPRSSARPASLRTARARATWSPASAARSSR
jgi:hypothetical protein